MAGGPFFSRPLAGMKKGPAASYSRAGGSRTTLGDGALDFRVRNGNGYDCLSMATGPENWACQSGTKENHSPWAGADESDLTFG